MIDGFKFIIFKFSIVWSREIRKEIEKNLIRYIIYL